MSIAELRLLSPVEKLRIIETLWGDLATADEDIQAPGWQEPELRRTEADFAAGREEAIERQTAKAQLRARFE